MSAGIADCEPSPQPQTSTNTQGTRLTCSFYGCKQAFSNMQRLASHIESHQIPTQSLPGKGFCCSSLGCNGTFPSMQHLMEHMRHHYKPNHYFLCESCRAKLRSYRSLFKHLHTCAKVAKSKAAKADELNPPVNTTMMEAAEFASAADAAASAASQGPVKEEPMELELAPLATEPTPLATVPAPPATEPAPPATEPAPPATESSSSNTAQPLATLQTSVSVLQETLPPPPAPLALPATPASPTPPLGPLSLTEPTAFTAEPGSFLPYPPPVPPSPPAPPGQRPARPIPPTPPAPLTPPGSNAVWKKNQGQSFSSRILWEHTRGRYSCLQCGHSTTTRQEMTAHIEGQHRSPAGRPQNDMDIRGSLPFQPKASLDTETAVYTQL